MASSRAAKPVGLIARLNGQPPPDVALADVGLGSSAHWDLDDDFHDGAFATLRREAPIAFFPETGRSGRSVGKGFWALTTHADVRFASRNPELFRSAPTTVLTDQPSTEIAGYVESMINLDDPRHHRLRSIVSRAFTPTVLARTEDAVLERARSLVAAMVSRHRDGVGEFVSEVAAPLPLQVICDMMGVPEADHGAIFDWTNLMMGVGDRDVTPSRDQCNAAVISMGTYGKGLAEDRRRNPKRDLTTSLVQAEVDGERLSSGEIASFFILLAIAGNETTRHATSHGLLALTRHPEQRQAWWGDFEAHRRTAVEEIVRWSTPVRYMRRTLSEDVELSGVRMRAGDKVALWYSSANRDERRFTEPWKFDVLRDPNPHMGYGGGGAHFCLGANLARREIAAVFHELKAQVPDIVVTEDAARLRSAFVHGIKRLSVSWSPGGRA
ncbi:cytochrome P450 [Mycobacterium sp. AT1]|uniref:cytochrome P450 n=1 Tax=Mycobacterium sp. AT1 TaxID=1961706 RepID=UPI0009ACC8EB|nr:cytochrome P450 [Mycobacterium sp. AT1]OPX06492.1 cytochrome [Mycobacterium sp. AT1]